MKMDKMILKPKLDREYLLNDSKRKSFRLQVGLETGEGIIANQKKGVHFCILLDISGSMYFAIENTACLSQKIVYIEGKPAYETTGEGTIDLAVKALKEMIEDLDDNDKVTLITYHEEATVAFEGITKHDKDKINDIFTAIQYPKGQDYTKKFTNISNALKLGCEVLEKAIDTHKKMIFITDGRPTFNAPNGKNPIDSKEKAILSSKEIALAHLPIDYIGLECMKNKKSIGEELDFEFLEDLSRVTNGNVYLTKDEDSLRLNLLSIVKNSKTGAIKNTHLILKYSNEVIMKDYFMVLPQNKYYGKVKSGSDRTFSILLNEFSEHQSYKFIFDLDIELRDEIVANTLDMGVVKVRYEEEVNGVITTHETQQQVITLKVGNDAVEARKVDGEIIDAYQVATIKKYEKLYQDAYRAGNRDDVVINMQKIIDIYEDYGYTDEAEFSRGLMNQYKMEGKLSQSDINKSGITSTTIKTNVPKMQKLMKNIGR